MLSQSNGLVQLTVAQMVAQLSDAYSSLIKSSFPLYKFPSIMLWGPPGVGKSQGVRQIAAEIQQRTGKRVVVTDVRLLLFNPVDLRGIPTANAEKTLAVWLRPKIFDMDADESVINILFLDEITAAPQSVQAAAYQITLDRTVGEHKLPDNCIIIAAGNRVTDRSVAFNMPKALANRLCHIEIKGDAGSWHEWALQANVHPFVMGYLDYISSTLTLFDPVEDNLAFPTPRSWEMVSNILNSVSDNLTRVYPLIAGCIGTNTAGAFRTWCEIYQHIPPLDQIFEGKPCTPPDRPELLYATVAAMVDYARKSATETELVHSIDFACTMPMEFRFRLFHDYYRIRAVRQKLEKNSIFSQWVAFHEEENRV
ncbi:MAG: ATP-binding protein [Oscillospiraceae bacterium]|nr:ATP-binding protein [Oscillospiraceae bacterium]